MHLAICWKLRFSGLKTTRKRSDTTTSKSIGCPSGSTSLCLGRPYMVTYDSKSNCIPTSAPRFTLHSPGRASAITIGATTLGLGGCSDHGESTPSEHLTTWHGAWILERTDNQQATLTRVTATHVLARYWLPEVAIAPSCLRSRGSRPPPGANCALRAPMLQGKVPRLRRGNAFAPVLLPQRPYAVLSELSTNYMV